MQKEQLKSYRKNNKELAAIGKNLERLYDQLDNVPVVSGKVTGSSKNFPYITTHMSVQMDEPVASDKIQKRIDEKEKRQAELVQLQKDIEKFIKSIPNPIAREIFEAVYINGEYQSKVGERIGYTQGRISQLISETLKD